MTTIITSISLCTDNSSYNNRERRQKQNQGQKQYRAGRANSRCSSSCSGFRYIMFLALLMSILLSLVSRRDNCPIVTPVASFSPSAAYSGINRHILLQNPRSVVSTLRAAESNEDWMNESADDGDDTTTTNSWTTDSSTWSNNEWSSSEDNDDDNSENAQTPTEESSMTVNGNDDGDNDYDYSESWIDALASISAEEIEFNQKENERAEKVFRMQEWGFDDETIKNTFSVEMDDALETKDEVDGMKEYRTSIYKDDVGDGYWDDAKDVESHTTVEKDPKTGEPIRQQMVYVDEHACIGCTNCAMIADSTFFMEDTHGRARVFEQWGDSEETIKIAIETCPVDCIHYVPFEELVDLEIERREQNINPTARLVNQGEAAHMASTGSNGFTAPQAISGNLKGSRCNNCPSKGCKNCPMFGVGKNPEYERKEAMRLERKVRRQLDQERRDLNKSADL